jgi:hypothetical protein
MENQQEKGNVIRFTGRYQQPKCEICNGKGRLSAISRKTLMLSVFRCSCDFGQKYYGDGFYQTFTQQDYLNYWDVRATS